MTGCADCWCAPVNDKLKGLFGIGVAGFIALFALHGKAFLDALAGFPTLVQAWASGLPLGLWSALLALSVAMGVWGYVLHWLPVSKCGKPPEFAASTSALLVALAVMLGQEWVGGRKSASGLLTALWMGAMVGFLAPWLGQGIRSLFRQGKR